MMKGLHTDRFSKKRRSSGSSNGSAEAHSPGAHVNGGGKKSNGVSIFRFLSGSSSSDKASKSAAPSQPTPVLPHTNGAVTAGPSSSTAPSGGCIGMRGCGGSLEYYPRVQHPGATAVNPGVVAARSGPHTGACDSYHSAFGPNSINGAASVGVRPAHGAAPVTNNNTDTYSRKGAPASMCNGAASSSSVDSKEGKSKRKSRISLLLPGRERKDSSSNEEGAKGVYVLKEMSAADQKLLDEAIELTNQFSANRLQSDHSPKDDEPGTPSGKSKSSRFFKFPSASSKKSPKSEKKTFTDDLNSKSHQLGCTTPEAEAAYNVLVAGAPSQEEVSAGRHSQEDVNAGRRLKMEGHGPSKGQHAPVAKRPSTEHNPPLPPRQSRVGGTSPPSRRPTDMPPLPPVGRRRSAHDDLRDLPSTPPPPLPSRGGAMDEDRLEELGLYNSQDPFWRVDMRLSGEEAEEDEDDGLSLPMQGKYKSRSDNVSYEDLTDFSSQNNGGNDPGKTHRVMQKVLGDVTTSERENALLATNGDVHKAVKYVRLRQLMRLSMGDINRCKEALMYSNWIVQNAVDYMLDHPPPSPDTVDV